MTEQHEHPIESDQGNLDAGGKAHTSETDEHPAGDGARTDREVGGPVSEDAERSSQ
jgi:hypothetical protein